MRFLEVSTRLLADPNRMLWVTAQGRFADPRLRPLGLRGGVAHLVDVVVLPQERHRGHVDLDRLCLSPQCGFASSLRGNLLSEDEQFRKLDVMLETARKVWAE